MPVTTLRPTAAYYGNSKYASFSETATSHLYVGYTGGSGFNYRSLLKFPSLKSIAAIGTNAIVISKVQLFCYRTDQGSTTVVAGPSASTSWNASLAGTGSSTWAASSSWKSLEITNASALAAIRDYTGAWYLHLRGTANQNYIRLASTGSSQPPYIQVTWEYADKTVTFTDGEDEIDSLECDGSNTVTISIDSGRYASDASYALSYAIGDQSGTIVSGLSKNGSTTTTTWTPAAELLNEITQGEAGDVSITLTAYNSGGGVYRTEKAVISLTVPAGIVLGVPRQAVNALNGFGAYGLTGRSALSVVPVVDASGLYGATIAEIRAVVTQYGGASEELVWESADLDDEIALTWEQGHYDTSGNFFTPDTWASSQNTYLPRTSNLIPVIQGVPLDVEVTLASANSSRWMGVARFDASGAFLGRSALTISASDNVYTASYTPAAADVYVRVIYRSFGSGTATVTYNGMICGGSKSTQTLTQAGAATVSLEAVDTRGRNADMTGYTAAGVTVLEYAPPAIAAFDVDRIAPTYDSSEQLTGYAEADDGAYAWAQLLAEAHTLEISGTENQALTFTLSVTDLSDGSSAGTRSGTLTLAAGTPMEAELEDDLTTLFPTGMISGDAAAFDTGKGYEFELTVTDAAGVSATAYARIVPGRANMHLAGSKYGVAFGGFSRGTEPDPLLESYYPAVFYEGIDVRGGAWIEMNRPSDIGEGVAAYDMPGIYYRVENGNHVYVHANISTKGVAKSFPFQINNDNDDETGDAVKPGLIPAELRPSLQVHAIGCCNGSWYFVRGYVANDGRIYIYEAQNTASTSQTTSYELLWTSLMWEWFI